MDGAVTPSLALPVLAAASTDAVDGSTVSFLLQLTLQYKLEAEKRKKEKEEKERKAKEEDDNAFVQSLMRKHGISPRGSSSKKKKKKKRRKEKLPKLRASCQSSSTPGSFDGGRLFTKEDSGESTTASVCWTTQGVVTPGQSGSRWSFSLLVVHILSGPWVQENLRPHPRAG